MVLQTLSRQSSEEWLESEVRLGSSAWSGVRYGVRRPPRDFVLVASGISPRLGPRSVVVGEW